jgi:hypothetical protein
METTNTTNATFTIAVDSCESCPKIVASFDNVPADKLSDMLYYAEKTFRSIEVVNNETGEFAYRKYVGFDLFKKDKRYNYGDSLDYMKRVLDKE